jgi:protein-disulfide isomerase
LKCKNVNPSASGIIWQKGEYFNMLRKQDANKCENNWIQIIIQTLTIILLASMTFYFYKMQATISDLMILIRDTGMISDDPANSTLRAFDGTISVQDSPVLNDLDSSKVVVVEYTDFECPFCAQASQTMAQLQKEHPDVLFVHKDYPLKYHSQAEELAVAARCAGEQGKYWGFYHSLYETPVITNETYSILAEKHLIDISSFMVCLNNPEQHNRVKRDFDEGLSIKVDRVPLYIVGAYTAAEHTIHINGAFYSIEELAAAVEFYKNR